MKTAEELNALKEEVEALNAMVNQANVKASHRKYIT